MKYIMGCDIGFGDVKVTVAQEDGDIIKQFKFQSVLAATQLNEHLRDEKIAEFKGHHYYIGADALLAPSESIIDITDYKNLEYYAPLFLYKAIQESGIMPAVVVTGLSKAQIENSGFFKANLQSFEVQGQSYKFDQLFVLPQGAGSKKCIDVYGDNFPTKVKDFTATQTYVGCDIGFNTLDMFMVSNGKTSSNLFEGIENEGVLKIAREIAKKVHELFNRKIGLHEAKEVIDTGVYKIRGQKHDMSAHVEEIKKQYVKNLLELIDQRYESIIDKCDFISLSGGGSAILQSVKDQFIRIPKTSHEYYNSIGFTLFGIDKV